MWDLDHKKAESWRISFRTHFLFLVVTYKCEIWTIRRLSTEELMDWTVELEKTLESPLDCKEIKPVNPKGNQPIFIGRTDAKAEAPILWPPGAKSQLIRRDPDTDKDWGQEVKEATKDEIFGWHHQLHGHESEQTSGDSKGQGSLACCSPWGGKERDTTEWLNSNNKA